MRTGSSSAGRGSSAGAESVPCRISSSFFRTFGFSYRESKYRYEEAFFPGTGTGVPLNDQLNSLREGESLMVAFS